MNTNLRNKIVTALAAGAMVVLTSALPALGQEVPSRKWRFSPVAPPVIDPGGPYEPNVQGPCDCDNWTPGPVIIGRRKPPIAPSLP